MRRVIVAFERQAICDKLCQLLENSGEFSCLVCHSCAQVRQAAHRLHSNLVVCGFKLADEGCEALYGDLPRGCSMLMLAPPAQLKLCETVGIFSLPTPVRRTELLTVARLLSTPDAGSVQPQRTQEERSLIERAKAVLMTREGMSEDQAHRLLQKQSMDHGVRLVDTARRVLDQLSPGNGA